MRLTAAVAATFVLAAGEARADEPVFGLAIAIARENGARVVDDVWLDAQIAEANRFFVPLGTRVRWTIEKELADAHAALHTRADRDALTPLGERGLIDVYVVRELEDVDEPGRLRMGVCWTGLGDRRIVVVSRDARPTVLAHELGHFFGNHPHSPTPNNLMSYTRDGGTVFLDEAQMATVRRTSAALFASGRLVDVGVPWRFL